MATSTLSLITVKLAFAQTPTSSPIPTPSVPTFTVQLAGPPYTVPTTYSLNQSSGQIVAQLGYIIEYPNVVVTIKNQPFTTYTDSSGNTVNIYYNIQIKPHAQTDNWETLYSAEEFPQQSLDPNYTNISLSVEDGAIPVGAQTDIQVEVMTGYVSSTFVAYNPNPPYIADYNAYSFVGQTGNWSTTQTVTVPNNIPLSPTPAPSASTPQSTLTHAAGGSNYLFLIAAASLVVIAFLLVIIIVLAFYVRKKTKTKT